MWTLGASGEQLHPLKITSTIEERVNLVKYIGVNMSPTEDLTLSVCPLLPLQTFRKSPQTLQTVLLSGNVTACYGSSTLQDHEALQGAVQSGKDTTGDALPSLQHSSSRQGWTTAGRISWDRSCPNNGPFEGLQSGKCFSWLHN